MTERTTAQGTAAQWMAAQHSITISLPVRNLRVSMAFFGELGFTFSPELTGPDCACLVIADNVRVMLLEADHFRDRVNGDMIRSGCPGEVLICLPTATEQEVDDIVMRAIIAGGQPWPMLDDRPVYSGSFRDPDGHIWQLACPREEARRQAPVPGPRIAA